MYPPKGVSYRGGGLPLQFVTQLAGHPPPFYVAGKKYRVPMFLASSFNIHVAENFCVSAEDRGETPVIWTIKVDARGASQPGLGLGAQLRSRGSAREHGFEDSRRLMMQNMAHIEPKVVHNKIS